MRGGRLFRGAALRQARPSDGPRGGGLGCGESRREHAGGGPAGGARPQGVVACFGCHAANVFRMSKR